MVKIKNIRVVDGRIYMDCYMDGIEEDHFTMVMDAEDLKVEKCSLNDPSIYARQAADKIRELAEKGPLPSEALSVWC